MNETDKPMTELSFSERRQRAYETKMVRIGALIAQGYTLPAIAQQPGMPSIAMLRQSLAENENLRNAYEQARDLRNEQLADDAVVLADTIADTNTAGLKLRIDIRKWRAGLSRKDGKKEVKTGNWPPPDLAERLQRAHERVKKYAVEDRKRLRAQIAVELAEQYGFTLDQETIDLAKEAVLHDWKYKGKDQDK